MLLFQLLCFHALCDYPLQSDFLAKGKNHRNPIPGIPWYHCLVGHALIHGGAVALATGRVELGVAETVIHAITDYAKCEGVFGFDADQAVHILCKFLWWGVVLCS